jgi:hypothetical protein
MKNLYYYLIATALISIAVILALYVNYNKKLEAHSYSFSRKISHAVKTIKRFDLGFNSYYFSGQSATDLYLANQTLDNYLLRISHSMTDTQSVRIKIKGPGLNPKGRYMISVDSNNFYLFNGSVRSIFMGKTATWIAATVNMPMPFFQESIPLNNKSVFFRYVNSKTRTNSLRKVSVSGESIDNDFIFKKQVDGLFCTSGQLEYNSHMNLLTYMYYYRNEILLIDTNLKETGKIKTIDPIDTARIEISKIKSKNASVATSSLLVNAKSATWKNYIFVLSKLMGKHEDNVKFKTSTVLDIYDLRNRSYRYSIYLPDQDKLSNPAV